MKRKLVYIGFAFAHHNGTHAGYHQIKEYLNYDYVIDCQSYHEKYHRSWGELNPISKLWRKILQHFFHINCIPWYLCRILWLNAIHKDLIFHYIYGDDNFFPWTKKIIKKSNKVVCTFHQPFSFYQNSKKWGRNIHNADFIILVSNAEIEKFKMMTKKDNVIYIPHGISTHYYKIDNNVNKEEIVLTVGNWLRDYRFADRVYSRLLEIRPNLSIHIVSDPKNKEIITLSERIKFMSGITDDQLKEEYQKCSILFLPLTRYTANNALLEASSTGCNIVIASDYPDNSYLPEQYVTIVKMDEETTVKSILEHMSLEYNKPLSAFISSNYGWEEISKKTEKFLRSIY